MTRIRGCRAIGLVLVAAGLVLAATSAGAGEPATQRAPAAKKAKPHRTDWFHEARWGVMFHFASAWLQIEDRDEWSKTLAAFDVDGLARQLHEVGAGYLIITATHYGYPLCPNKQDKNGTFPSHDLVPRLSAALAKRGIRLMLYYPTCMGGRDDKPAKRSASIIRELSLRYGKKVSGWWLDNNSPFQVDRQKMMADAARAGNPDTILGFSGPRGQQRNSPFEDFTAGNTRPARHARCYGRFIEGVQWHMLSPLGHSWSGVWKVRDNYGNYAPRFTTLEAADMTTKIVANGGVVTWDVPPLKSGLIHPAFIYPLKAIGFAVKRTKRNPDPLAAFKRPELPKPFVPPAPPKGAIVTTLGRADCRSVAASDHWPLEKQIGRLATSVGTSHNHHYRGCLRFDLSGIDRTRPVQSAVLCLRLEKIGLAPFAGSPLTVARFTQPVNDTTPKWYNFPAAEAGQAQADDTKVGTIALDVTKIVKAWLAGRPNYGLRLSSTGLGEDWRRFPLTTKEYNAGRYDPKTNPHGPRLVIHQLPK